MKPFIIEVPAGKQFFEIGELPRLFADAVPNPADTEEANFAVRIVMEQGRFWELLKAAAEDGTLPVTERYTRIRGPFPTNLNTKYLLVHIDDLRDWARIKGFDVRVKAEEQEAPEQATAEPAPEETPVQAETNAAPAQHEAERPPDVEQAKSEGTWQEQARQIATEVHCKATLQGYYLGVKEIADKVEGIARDKGIVGPYGPLTAGNILREALQGKKWHSKRPACDKN